MILGALCGYLATFFNHVVSKMVFLRARIKNPFIAHRWKFAIFTAVLVSVITFPVPFMHFTDKRVLNTFFSNVPLELQKGIVT